MADTRMTAPRAFQDSGTFLSLLERLERLTERR
jgi:hypothetical protein